MMLNDSLEFQKKLLETFRGEAEDHLKTMTTALVQLETAGPEEQKATIEIVFRAMHSLKGAARSVDQGEIEAVCQSLEDLCSNLKKGKQEFSREALNELTKGLDQLNALLERNPTPIVENNQLPQDSSPQKTIRVSATRLNSVLFQAEEMLSIKLASAQRLTELRNLEDEFQNWKKIRIKQTPEIEKELSPIEVEIRTLIGSLEQDHRSSAAMVDQLLEDVKTASMLPFSFITDGLSRTVRELAEHEKKEVGLFVHGADVEMDRRILEEIKDPLVHIVRNCIDHGLETPEIREANHKPKSGTLSIEISQKEGNKIELKVTDDGQGVDPEAVRAASVKSGDLTAEEARALTDDQAILLIFRSGVSTSPILTEISGRGLGLAIVREKIEKLGGSIELLTKKGESTTFRIELPLTLASFWGLLVQTRQQTFSLPLKNVARVLRVNREGIKTIENRGTIEVAGEVLPLVDLATVLGIPSHVSTQPRSTDWVLAVVLTYGTERIAFSVDEIIGTGEILFKSFSKHLARIRNLSGATVLGNGQVVPILNVLDLMGSSEEISRSNSSIPSKKEPSLKATKSILIVEDSITSRTLLKGILQAAGYRVKTAVDGLDAFTTLKTESFDLVVSDIDMPRMNGLELTKKIRSDTHLAHIPVILVTSNEGHDIRQSGINAGANAYIVKSNFNQSNLLEAIERFI